MACLARCALASALSTLSAGACATASSAAAVAPQSLSGAAAALITPARP